MRPLLSVVIPVYGVEPYIKECIESVQAQHCPDLEILCIDDASPDRSAEIIRKMAETDGRIRLLKNEHNLGLSASRNKGLKEASGRYIYFLDADDMLAEGALSCLLPLMREKELDAAVFAASFLFESEALKEAFSRNPALFKGSYEGVYTGRELLLKWMEIWDWMPSQPRWIYDREFLLNNGLRYREQMLHEDEIFTLDVLMRAGRLAVDPHPWFIRRFRSGSIMTGIPGYANIRGCIEILSAVSGYVSEALAAGDEALVSALNFYRSRIAANVRNKFRQAFGEEPFRVSEEGPKVSVVMPVYNTAPFLRQCMDSILSQDLTELEVIAVDDASCDASGELLEDYARMDPRVTVFVNEENKGQAASRNRGIEAVSGEYLYMMDSDDLLKAGALSRLYKLCRERNADLVGFENEQFTEQEEFRSRAEEILFSYETTQGVYEGKDAFVTAVMRDTLSPSIPTFFMRRDLLTRGNIRFREGSPHEDIGFLFKLFLWTDRTVFLHEVWFRRRFRSHSTVTSPFSAEHAKGYLASWQTAFECAREIEERYGSDPDYERAVRKWKRDVLGRIRTLYLTNETELYRSSPAGELPFSDTEWLLSMLEEVTTGSARALDILGEDLAAHLQEASEVYICGGGQYARRAAEAAGALGILIGGFILTEEERAGRKSFLGFPVIRPEELPQRCRERSDPTDPEKKAAVLMAVSHYRAGEYEALLRKAGIRGYYEFEEHRSNPE